MATPLRKNGVRSAETSTPTQWQLNSNMLKLMFDVDDFCRHRSSSESWLDLLSVQVLLCKTTSHRFGNFHCNSARAHLFSLTLPWKVQRLPSFTRKFNHSCSEINTAHLLRLWLRPQNSCCLTPAPFCSPWIHTPLAFHWCSKSTQLVSSSRQSTSLHAAALLFIATWPWTLHRAGFLQARTIRCSHIVCECQGMRATLTGGEQKKNEEKKKKKEEHRLENYVQLQPWLSWKVERTCERCFGCWQLEG